MSENPDSGGVASPQVADPDNVPVRIVNSAASVIVGQLCAMTLGTNRVRHLPDGSAVPDVVVAGRFRFDLEVAQMIKAQLDHYIAVMTPPPAGKAN